MLQLNNNIVTVSGEHKSDLVIPVFLLFQILLCCYIILSRVPVLNSRSLLVIHFKYSHVYFVLTILLRI